MEVRAASRAARETMIKMAFHVSMRNGNGDELTAYQIANKIGMRPQSPRFRDILSAMVRDGKLTMRELSKCNLPKSGGVRWIYKLGKELEPAKRDVPIKSGGVVLAQMSMFEVMK